jgi:hypothetical protein
MTSSSTVCCLAELLVRKAKPKEEYGREVFGLKDAASFRVKQVSKWNCVQHQSGIQWFTEKSTGCHFIIGTDLFVVVAVTSTNSGGIQTSLLHTPDRGISVQYINIFTFKFNCSHGLQEKE